MRRDGTPIPPEEIAEQLKRQSSGLKKRFAKARAKEDKPFACDRCPDKFKTAAELGRHRRFKHGIPGTSTTAIRAQQLAAATTAPPPPKPAPTIDALKKCPHCPQRFTERGMKKHITAAHSKALTKANTQMETIGNASNGKENGIIHHATANGKDIAHATAEALITAYATGILKGQITAIAESHDIPARQLAIRCAKSLLSEAQR